MAPDQQKSTVMKCQDLLALLGDYVDGQADPALCAEFERHMAGCNPCQVVVDNLRKTIRVYQAGQPVELPAAFRDRLHRALREQWKARGPNAGTEPPTAA